MPKKYDEYYYIDNNGFINVAQCYHDPTDADRIQLGNTFKTRQHAERGLEYLKEGLRRYHEYNKDGE